MSTPDKGKPSPKKSKNVTFKSEFNINVKTYYEVGKQFIYYLSKVNRSSVDSLEDRGANGASAGNNVRFIATCPDRTVDTRGIDNHEITAMPLITSGGVASTISGEVIVIMHQYVHHGKNKTIH